MRSFLLPEWRAFLRYTELPGDNPVNIYLAGFVLAVQPSFFSIVAGDPRLAVKHSLFVDLLGSGFSDAPSDFSYSIEDHARTLAMLIDDLGLRACNLIGYSMSGAVAIMLAAIRPDLVACLVLMEANLDPLKAGEGKASTQIASQSEAQFCAHGYQTLLNSFRLSGLEGNETMATLAGMLQAASPRALHRGAIHLVKGTRPTMREKLLQMTLPRTYIFGQRSLPDPKWKELADGGVQVMAVENTGHGMAWDNPKGTADAIARALAS